MRKPESILGRLNRSLAWVTIIGALALLILIGIEYRISFVDVSDAAALDRVIHELTEHVVVPMILLAAPMAIAARWAIGRAIRPLADAARQIDAAQGEKRGVRIQTGSLPREVLPFADAVNALIGRVDEAAAQHEAFAADIAHELRTPLTLLSLELDQLEGEKAERLRQDVAAMRRLIDQLMLLAQIEAEQAALVPPVPVDLYELASDVVAQMAPAALAQGRALELQGENRGSILGRREAIGAALRNMIENALRVTPEGEPVVLLSDRPGQIAVRDGGSGLSEERLRTLVQRLRRADHASSNGAGLGLAIVSRIMAAHSGLLTTDPERRELRLIFPVG